MQGRIEYRSSIIQAGALARAALAAVGAPLRRQPAATRLSEREERSYRRYFRMLHQAYREFSQLRPAEQRAYWHWRATHECDL